MMPVESVPIIRRGEMGEKRRGWNSSMIYLIHCKNLCKCYSVPHPAQKNNNNNKQPKAQRSVAPPCPVTAAPLTEVPLMT
jgi:hypothetical protein